MNGLDRWAQYNYFWDVISPTLSTPERQVWLAIFRHADTFGIASVTRSRIGDMIGVTPKAVSDGIKGLSKRKLIAKIPHGYGYKLCITCNENVTPSNEKVTDDSNENVTPPSRKRYTPCNEKVTTTVTKTLHNTELHYRTDIQNTSTQLPPTPQTPKQKAVTTESEQFNLFYAAYPKKRNRPAALKAWNTKKINESIDIILASLERWKASRDWTKDNGKFIPYPASWLNAEGWNDDIEPEKNEEQRKFDADLAGLGF